MKVPKFNPQLLLDDIFGIFYTHILIFETVNSHIQFLRQKPQKSNALLPPFENCILHVDDFNECLFTCQKWIPFQNIFNLSLPIVRALFLVIRHRKRYMIAKQHNFRVTSAILQSMLTFLKSSLKGVYAWLSKPKILVQLMWNIVQKQFESNSTNSES